MNGIHRSTTAAFRSRIRLCIMGLVFFVLAPASTWGQVVGPINNLGMQISPEFRYDRIIQEDAEHAYYAQLRYARLAPSSQVSPDSRSAGLVNTLFFSAGARTKDFDTFEFRWRAGLLDMDITRIPLSMGVTLIDYNQSELLDVDVKWANLRFGPSIYLGTSRTFFTLRAVGTGGITTLRPGMFAYEGLASQENLTLRKRSYEIGYLGEFEIFLANVFYLAGRLEHRNLLGGIRPRFYEATGYLGIKFDSRFSARATYSFENSRARQSSIDRHILGISITYLL